MADEENPLGGGPFGVGPFGPLVGAVAVAATAFAFATVSNARVGTSTLFYHAKIEPPVFASIPPTPSVSWIQPLSRAVPYPKVPGTRPAWTFGYPYEGVEEPVEFFSADVTSGRASSRTLFYQSRAGPVSAPPAEDNTVTIEKWQPPFSRATQRAPTETGLYTPFVPSRAPVVTVEWMRPFDRAAPLPREPQSQVTYTYVVLAEDNTVTPDKWLVRWDVPPRKVQRLQPGQPFVPREAVLENTQTPDKWLQPFYKAVPVPPVHVTQPVLGYPYEAAANLTTSIEWLRQWQGPPRLWPLGKPFQPFVPEEATLENTVTPDKWLQAFRPPPRYWPIKVQALPFVPREAVLENTVTPDKWLFRFQGAVPRPPVRHTQPLYGYPYEAASNLTTSIEWLQKWQGPPRYTALRSYPYQPFIPRAAVLENTVTPDKWLRGFDRATRKRPVNVTQPALPPQAAPVAGAVTPSTYWFQPLSRSVKLTAPYIGRAYFAGPVLPPQEILPQIYQFVPSPPTYVTFRKLTQYQAWVKVPGIIPPGPITSWVQSPDITVTFTRTVQFPSRTWTVEYIPPFFGEGPAPEPERVVCVLAACRVATEPLLLREAVVPVTLRTATVPELDRVVVTLDSEVIVQSNEYRDEPCPPFGNEGCIPGEPTPEVGPLTAWVQSPDTTVTLTRTIQFPSWTWRLREP